MTEADWDRLADMMETIVATYGVGSEEEKQLAEKLGERPQRIALVDRRGWFDDEGQVQQP